MELTPQFGQCLPGAAYRDRPGAYSLIDDGQGRLLICRTPRLVMLPGGGIDPGETPVQALAREVAEETGLAVTAAHQICRANQYIKGQEGEGYVNKLGFFFLASIADHGHAPVDDDHETLWLTHAQTADSLSHKFQRWAVRRLGDMTHGHHANVFWGEGPPC